MLQENEKCVAEHQSAKQSIENIEKVVVKLIQFYENIEDAQNKNIGTKDLDKSTTMGSGRTVSTRKFQLLAQHHL